MFMIFLASDMFNQLNLWYVVCMLRFLLNQTIINKEKEDIMFLNTFFDLLSLFSDFDEKAVALKSSKCVFAPKLFIRYYKDFLKVLTSQIKAKGNID